MHLKIAQIALVVKDYDEAIAFYTRKLNFTVVEDTFLTESKRWVLIAPPGSPKDSCRILLAKAANEQQLAVVGKQTGGRVFLFLHTDNIERDYQNLLDQGIAIVRPLTQQEHGKVAVFADLYGNLWDLIQPTS